MSFLRPTIEPTLVLYTADALMVAYLLWRPIVLARLLLAVLRWLLCLLRVHVKDLLTWTS
jgi:hypothetical protein